MNKKYARFASLGLLLLVFTTGCSNEKEKPPYKDVSKSFEQRAAALISKMTLKEKVGQMSFDAPAIKRLGIPKYNWWNEALHGVARAGKATVFPQAIGMAAMFDREQMSKVSTAISDEARAKHAEFASRGKRGIYQGLTFWTPNINIFRDPRWGRGMETYGEDPYLSGELGVRFVKGLQGDDPKYLKVVATAKHFEAHSGPEATRHRIDVDPSPYDMLNTYSPHFEKLVKEGHVYSVMCAYNSFRGKPCCGNKELSDLLRKKWGFKGYIVSDCGAVRDFYAKGAHHVVENKQEAAAMAVKAGTDLNCGNSYPALVEAVKNGLITEKEIDVSVKRLFVARMKLGLFAPKGAVKYNNISFDVVDSEAHRLLALATARKSMVLLKNKNEALPLAKKKIKKIAVIGPNANDPEVLLGNYNGFPSHAVTPLEGIQKKVPNATVSYAVGSRLAKGLPLLETLPSSVLYTDSTKTTHGLQAAYYDNIDFKGTPKHKRIDKTADFIFRTTPPFKDMAYDKYSVRWKGVLSVKETGEYALGGEAFSSMKLFLNDSLVVQRQAIHHPKKIYKYVHLEAGKNYKLVFQAVQNNTEYAIMRLLWEAPQNNLAEKALKTASDADIIVMFMGLSPRLEGEQMKVKVKGFAEGDRVNTNLPESQTNLMKKLKKLGKPVVLVLLNGSALSINWENEHLPAILEAWYPGQAGGTAIADVLFGDYNPAGRLPITFYKDIHDIPAFDDYDMKGKTYRYFKGNPLYEFGYGLSYTHFEYSNLKIPDSVEAGKTINLSVDVENTGKMDGEETVQVYVNNEHAGPHNPFKTLAGFKRIALKKGEKKTVKFTIAKKQLMTVNNEFKEVIRPGKINIWVGGAQASPEREKAKKVLTKTIAITGKTFFLKD